jgi:hypothetical protein
VNPVAIAFRHAEYHGVLGMTQIAQSCEPAVWNCTGMVQI